MIVFGTGGWRAIIADEFTFENVRRVARALSIMARRTGTAAKPVIIGHDLRFLSGRFSKAFAEVLAGDGIPVLFVQDPAPTPMIMLGVEQEGLDFGIMITASHNPPEYNGIKVIVEKGRDAPVEITSRIEDILRDMPSSGVEHGDFLNLVHRGAIRYYSNRNAYIDSLLAQVDIAAIKERNLRVLFNPMHGVATDVMGICLSSLRCSVNIINRERDTMFGAKPPSPDRESLQDMEFIMKEGRYDLGVATDGDSDRIGLYDELGNYVDANATLKLLYYYMKEYRRERGGVARNITTTHVLDRIAAHYGEVCRETPVGFKYISAAMDENDLLMGGESSGGLKIRGHVNGKDGILAALLAVEMLAVTGEPLSKLAEEIGAKFGRPVFHMLNLKYIVERRDELTGILMRDRHVPDFGRPVARVSYIDGAKYYFDDGSWLSIRFSGTEPLLRVAMEMWSAEQIKQMVDAVIGDERLQLGCNQ